MNTTLKNVKEHFILKHHKVWASFASNCIINWLINPIWAKAHNLHFIVQS